ncbi:MAG: sugar phosphate isomerase/epimerase family protein [Armatimonadota bacterium]
MKLGLDSYSYRYAAGIWDYQPRENVPMTVGHYLEKAAELGLDGVQLADARHLDSFDYGYVDGLRGKAETLGLYLELGTSGTNPDHLQNMVRAAHVLGSKVVRTFVGRPRATSVEGMAEILSEAAGQLGDVLTTCERYGVSLAIENHQDLTTSEVLELLEIVDSQWVGVCFDTGNSLATLDDPMEAARAFGPLVKTVHLKDYQLCARPEGFVLVGCALGEGVVDLRGIIDLLGAEAPEAHLNIEAYIGKHEVPALEDGYLRQFPEVPAAALGATLRLVRDRGLPREPVLPVEPVGPEDELLAAEEELVLRSVRWASAALGRSEPDTPDDA